MKRNSHFEKHLAVIAVLTILAVVGTFVTFAVFLQVHLWIYACCETEYAPDFSQHAFQKLVPGQTTDEVLRALGEPLEKCVYEKEGYELWFYTRSPNSTHYFLRAFRIERSSNVVLEKVQDLYFD